MQCELCGSSKGEFSQAIIEGSLLEVCPRCSKFGAVIQKHPEHPEQPGQPTEQHRQTYQSYHYSEPAEHIAADYASKIKLAREKKKITQEDLANAVAEKLSIIQKVESSTFTPPVKLCKKLEQYLQIKLVLAQLPPPPPQEKKLDLKDHKLTIGDLLGFKFHAHKKDPGS